MTVARMLAIVAVVFPAVSTLHASPQSDQRAPAVPTADPQLRIRELRAELDRIRSEMVRLEQESRQRVEELRVLERDLAAGVARKGRVSARELSQSWIAAVQQIDDAQRRADAIESIRAAVAGRDPDTAQAGMLALCQIAETKFDKQPFRALILPWTEHPDPALRRQALYALYNTAREPADLELVLAQVDDPRREMRDSIVHLLFMFSNRDLTGRAGDAVLSLLATSDRNELHQRLPGLWGARVSPAIAERLLELSRVQDHDVSHNAIYFGLSTLRDKSEPVVDRLIELLADPGENGGRALWGLGQGVPKELQPKVASAMLRLFTARSSPEIQASALRLVGMYGTPEHEAELERIASNELTPESLRKQAQQAAEQVRNRAR